MPAMPLEHPLISVAAVPTMPGAALGWDGAARLRIAVAAAQGSSTIAYHATLPAGAKRAPCRNLGCDEILIWLEGGGSVELSGGESPLRAGHCLYIPAGCTHALVATAPSVVVGFYPFAATPQAVACEPVGDGAGRQAKGALVHLDAVAPAAMAAAEGWLISDFRLPIGRHNGCGSTLFRARFFPGAVHKKHRHDACEEIYFVISGSGVAGAGRDRVKVGAGDFHYIARGVEHWLVNADAAQPIEVVGIYIGAGSVEETGYVYMGDVTAEDVRQV